MHLVRSRRSRQALFLRQLGVEPVGDDLAHLVEALKPGPELGRARYREQEHEAPVLAPAGSGWSGAKMHHLDAHRLRDGTWLACVDGYAADDSNLEPALEA